MLLHLSFAEGQPTYSDPDWMQDQESEPAFNFLPPSLLPPSHLPCSSSSDSTAPSTPPPFRMPGFKVTVEERHRTRISRDRSNGEIKVHKTVIRRIRFSRLKDDKQPNAENENNTTEEEEEVIVKKRVVHKKRSPAKKQERNNDLGPIKGINKKGSTNNNTTKNTRRPLQQSRPHSRRTERPKPL